MEEMYLATIRNLNDLIEVHRQGNMQLSARIKELQERIKTLESKLEQIEPKVE